MGQYLWKSLDNPSTSWYSLKRKWVEGMPHSWIIRSGILKSYRHQRLQKFLQQTHTSSSEPMVTSQQWLRAWWIPVSCLEEFSISEVMNPSKSLASSNSANLTGLWAHNTGKIILQWKTQGSPMGFTSSSRNLLDKWSFDPGLAKGLSKFEKLIIMA